MALSWDDMFSAMAQAASESQPPSRRVAAPPPPPPPATTNPVLLWGGYEGMPAMTRPSTLEIHLKRITWSEPSQTELDTCAAIDEVAQRIFKRAYRESGKTRYPISEKMGEGLWLELDTKEHHRIVPYLEGFPFVCVVNKMIGDVALKYKQLDVKVWELKSPADAGMAPEDHRLQTQREKLLQHPLPHCQKEYILEEEEWFSDKKTHGTSWRPYNKAAIYTLMAEISQTFGFRCQLLHDPLCTSLYLLTQFAEALIGGCKFLDRILKKEPTPCASLPGDGADYAKYLAKQDKYMSKTMAEKSDSRFFLERCLHLIPKIPTDVPRHAATRYKSWQGLIREIDQYPLLRDKVKLFENEMWAVRAGKPGRFGPKNAENFVQMLLTPPPPKAEEDEEESKTTKKKKPEKKDQASDNEEEKETKKKKKQKKQKKQPTSDDEEEEGTKMKKKQKETKKRRLTLADSNDDSKETEKEKKTPTKKHRSVLGDKEQLLFAPKKSKSAKAEEAEEEEEDFLFSKVKAKPPPVRRRLFQQQDDEDDDRTSPAKKEKTKRMEEMCDVMFDAL